MDFLQCPKMVLSPLVASAKTAWVTRSSPSHSLVKSHLMTLARLIQTVAVTLLSPSTMRPIGFGCNKQVAQATTWSTAVSPVLVWMYRSMARLRAIRRSVRIIVKPHNGSMPSVLISPPTVSGMDLLSRVVQVTTCTVQPIKQHPAR